VKSEAGKLAAARIGPQKRGGVLNTFAPNLKVVVLRPLEVQGVARLPPAASIAASN
jgi:hypothetical protein